MICVVLPAAHSAPDLCFFFFFVFFFLCLRRDRNYSALHRFFCCTLNWIFFPTCFNWLFWHLTFVFDLAADSRTSRSVISPRDMDHGMCLVSVFGRVLPPCSSNQFTQMLVIEGPIRHSCISSPVFGRYCPACDNFMQGKHRVWAIYVRKLVWNQHICEHDSPRAFLWSIIYVLCRAKKLYLKINFFAIPVILSLKGNGVYWVFMLMLGMNVKLEMKSVYMKKGKRSLRELLGCELMWCRADGACWVCAPAAELLSCLLSFSCCRWTSVI